MTTAERTAIEAVQDEYEMETGVRPSFDVASVYYDRRCEADSYREVMSDVEMRQLIEEDKEDAECRRLHEEEKALCAAGQCEHYTCTEGQALVDREASDARG